MSSCSEETEWFETSLSWGHILPLIFLALPIDSSSEFHIQINTRIWPLFISTLLVLPLYPNASKHVELITAFHIILALLSLEELSLHLVNRIIWKDCLVTSAIDPKIDPVTLSLGAGMKERSRDMWISTSFGFTSTSHLQQHYIPSRSFLTMKNSLHWISGLIDLAWS